MSSTGDANLNGAKAAKEAEVGAAQSNAIGKENLEPKYPIGLRGDRASYSAFLQKRLLKGHQYFDSADYEMARQKKKE